MDLKGSKTEKNLLAAFAGETQARTRYNYFASVAQKEGYEQIAEIFNETAENEKEHAKMFFKFLQGGEAEIISTYPAGMIQSVQENLKASADGEKHEWGALYPGFAIIAENEGFTDIAHTFRQVAKVEVSHERRFRKLLSNIEQNIVFKREVAIRWKCRNCGYVHEGNTAPNPCPVCSHATAYFEIWCENY